MQIIKTAPLGMFCKNDKIGKDDIKGKGDEKVNLAVTIGKFEALHSGHKHLINLVSEYAQANRLASAVLSFAPNPIKVLHDADYKPLFVPTEQAALLQSIGSIDYWISHPFDVSFAQLSPKEFYKWLYKEMRCRALFVGEGFRFGRGREGTPSMLQDFSSFANNGEKMKVVTVPNQSVGLEKVSTSQIRALLEKGQMQEAAALLTRPFFLIGKVQKGRQLGRAIGFPTVNLHPPEDKFLPPDGVYVTVTKIAKVAKNAENTYNIEKFQERFRSITNIGTNPTVQISSQRKVETHIFDFNTDLYDQEILVEFHQYLRPQQTFDNLEALKNQIALDVQIAQKYPLKT